MKRVITPALVLAFPLGLAATAMPAAAVSTPSQPSPCSVTTLDGGYRVNWTRPADDGGGTIWRYTVKVKGQKTPVVRLDAANRKTENTRRSYKWTHRTSGGTTPLTFAVRAVNGAGAGPWCLAPVGTTTATDTSGSTDTSSGSDSTTAGSAFLPYGEDSFFQSETTGAPVDAGLTSSFRSFMKKHPDQASTAYPVIRGVGGNMWGIVYAEGKASDPVWTIRNHDGYGKSKTPALMKSGFHAPEWLGSMLTGTSDSPFTVVDRVNGFTVRGDKAIWVRGTHQIDIVAGGATGITYHSSNGLDGRNPRSDDARNFTSRGRISDAMVTRQEVDRAIAAGSDLGHVLTLNLVETLTSAGFVHPMVGTESGKYGWGAEGVRIAIDPAVDLTKRGLSPAALAIARTLQNYGAYLGDNAGSGTALNVEQETSARPVWNGLLTKDSLKGITWDDFVVVKPGWQ